jgi:rod shape determining protein RodA
MNSSNTGFIDLIIYLSSGLLLVISVIVLRSIAPALFPTYYIYLFIAVVTFIIVKSIDFDIFILFSPHLYFFSILTLLATLLVGQVTRGAVRWIPLGSITIQPSEVVRAFVLLYFAKYLTEGELNSKRFARAVLIALIPLVLILIQPSLGVAVLTSVGFFGIMLASQIEKRFFLTGFVLFLLLIPIFWILLAPYQKARIAAFLDPSLDPQGAGYNSIQSMISVGSGKILGRGLGEGVQTQLDFLPERHTDFIFASIAEEMGFLGSFLVLLGLFILFWGIVLIIERPKNLTARVFSAGVFWVFLAETMVHIGMNMGMVPITGVPLPFVSAGGSSLIGSSIMVAMALNAKR